MVGAVSGVVAQESIVHKCDGCFMYKNMYVYISLSPATLFNASKPAATTSPAEQ